MRHVGISFHDSAEMLDRILTEYPQLEAVQLQFNYVDYDDPAVQSRRCYEVCRKHGKPVIVMEPVKGGNLADLPEDAAAVLDALHGGSSASYAIRFAAGFPGIRMVLSGMSDLRQVEDNIAFMRDFKPLDETELAAVKRVQEIFRSKEPHPLHGLPLLHGRLPADISIPDLFAVMNAKQIHRDWNADYYYERDLHQERRQGLRLYPLRQMRKRSARSTYISATCWRTLPRNLKKGLSTSRSAQLSYFRASTSSARNIRWRAFHRLRTGDRNTNPRRRGCRAPR